METSLLHYEQLPEHTAFCKEVKFIIIQCRSKPPAFTAGNGLKSGGTIDYFAILLQNSAIGV